MKNLIIICVLVTVLGVVAFALSGLRQEEQKQESQQPIQPQTPKAELPKVLYNLGGTIQSLGADSFIIEAKIPEITEDYILVHRSELRTIRITPQTKITRLVFVVEGETGQKRPQETAISLAALKLGDSIEVISNKDVREGNEIQATQIRILPSN